MIENFKRVSLGHFPTPVEHLKSISKHLGGPQIYIKRDDCTGLATGGNKTRKLEYILADALDKKSDLVVTVGAIQSNHARQTAAACAKLGLKCLIILEHRLKKAPEIYETSGNVFLNKVFGAEVVLCPKDQVVEDYAEKIIQERISKGANPYFIPVGGSNHLGELGYIECMREIIENQNQDSFSHIILATGSGGTHAGLVAGKTIFQSDIKIIGISINHNKLHQEERVYQLALNSLKYVNHHPPLRDDVVVEDEYVGPGYAEPSEGMKEAFSMMATREGILLDPVYSGKAFDGLIGLIKSNFFKSTDKVLFLHTGGSAAIPAFEWAFD